MDHSYSYTRNNSISSSGSSNYSYSFDSSNDHQFPDSQYGREVYKIEKPQPAFRATLHSVRKFPGKNIITKKPIAPLPPTPPKIYKVDAGEFRDVVQKLTSAPEFQPTRLQEVAPPPLSLSPPNSVKNNPVLMSLSSGNYSCGDQANEDPNKPHKSLESTFGALSPLGFSLSPSSIAWCSYNLLSPGTLASFEPSAVL